MRQTTVLVGFAEALSAPEVVWSLADAGFRVVAFARQGRASAIQHSRYAESHEICAPETSVEAALAELRSLMLSLSGASAGAKCVFLPLDDKALYLGSKLQADESWILAGPLGANAELALNKSLQVEAAGRAGFLVPKTMLVRSGKEALDFAAAESFPIMLKAAECVPIHEGRVRSSRNWICASPEELNRALAQWGERTPLLAQTFVTGVGEGVFGLAAAEGIRAWSAHRRVRMMNPEGSGSSACISQNVSQDLKANVSALIKEANWHGLFMIELLRDHEGKLWFVELNGRTWGSMALARRQGLEYPAWHVQLAMDASSKAGQKGAGVAGLVCRNVGRELVHLLFVLRGAKSTAVNGRAPRWKAFAEVLRIRSGDTFYNWRKDDWKVFFADSYDTLHDNLFKSKH